MQRLFGVIVIAIILSSLNQGYGQPILEETPEEIIMQNSWIAVKIL